MNDRLQNKVEAVWSQFETAISTEIKAYLDLVNALIKVSAVPPGSPIVTGPNVPGSKGTGLDGDAEARATTDPVKRELRTTTPQVEPLEERAWTMQLSIDQLETMQPWIEELETMLPDSTWPTTLAAAVASDLTQRLLGELARDSPTIEWQKAKEQIDAWRNANRERKDDAVTIVFSEASNDTFTDDDRKALRDSLQPIHELSTKHFGWVGIQPEVKALLLFAPVTGGTFYSVLNPTLGWDRRVDPTKANIIVTEQSVLKLDTAKQVAQVRGAIP